MMGVRTPETCRAVNKRQVINLRNCFVSGWLIYLNCIETSAAIKMKGLLAILIILQN